MKAIGYVRVSTDQQADSGLSLSVQIEKIKAMSVVQGVELIDVIVDAGESAKNLKRPGMQKVLELVQAGSVQKVIVTKLDRLTRSVRDLAELLEIFERKKVSLVSVADSLDTATAAGRLVLNIMVSVSQWEREVIIERTREAMQKKKSIGQRAGNIPFGFMLSSDGKTLVPNEREQAVLKVLRELRAEGYTLREIATELNRQGFTTRKGGLWQHQYVASLAA